MTPTPAPNQFNLPRTEVFICISFRTSVSAPIPSFDPLCRRPGDLCGPRLAYLLLTLVVTI
jgi:hypothetical protein